MKHQNNNYKIGSYKYVGKNEFFSLEIVWEKL